MRLYLIGHDYKYAAEQIMLMMFPGQRPEYNKPEGEDGLSAYISLNTGSVYATAHTRLNCGGIFDGYSRVRISELSDKLVRDRLLQKIIKMSFFKAAREATGQNPVWGALTGIRPGKLVTSMMESGLSESQAVSRLCKEYCVTRERADLCLDAAKAGMAAASLLRPRDIALYVGIPFCPTRCAYCSFVSHSIEKAKKLIVQFLDALYLEIEGAADDVLQNKLNITSVYIGGGTPTTLTAGQLDSLLKKLASSFDLSSVREYTVEAGRPDTITAEKLRVLRNNGVTRISINPQTMSDSVLKAIGRRHSAQDVINAYDMARKENFCSINMDLIAGLPSDTVESFRQTLDAVMSLSPENITVHTLALKKGTKVTLEKMDIPSGEDVSKMLDYASHNLRGGGYMPYYLYRQKFMSGGLENIGWCRPGYESFYNICIMEELCTILALGGGGISKLVAPDIGRIERLFNAKYPYEYIENIEKSISGKKRMKSFYDKYIK